MSFQLHLKFVLPATFKSCPSPATITSCPSSYIHNLPATFKSCPSLATSTICPSSYIHNLSLQLHSQFVLPATFTICPDIFHIPLGNVMVQADSGMLSTSNIRGVMLYIICISNLTRMWNCPDFGVTKYVGRNNS